MSAADYNIIVEQGATFQLNITWKDEAGVVIDITGYTARMQVRATKAATTVLLAATTENGYITLGGVAGTVAISVPASVTAALSFVRAVYDLELISSTGIVTRLVQGGVCLSKEVTR